MSLRGTPTWRLHTKLYKFGWNVSPNNSRIYTYEKLQRSKFLQGCLYIIIVAYARFLNSSIECFRFYFWWRDMCKPPIDFMKTREDLLRKDDSASSLRFVCLTGLLVYWFIVFLKISLRADVRPLFPLLKFNSLDNKQVQSVYFFFDAPPPHREYVVFSFPQQALGENASNTRAREQTRATHFSRDWFRSRAPLWNTRARFNRGPATQATNCPSCGSPIAWRTNPKIAQKLRGTVNSADRLR